MRVIIAPSALAETFEMYYDAPDVPHVVRIPGRVSFSRGQFVADMGETFVLGEKSKTPIVDDKHGLTYHGFMPIGFCHVLKVYDFSVDYFEKTKNDANPII